MDAPSFGAVLRAHVQTYKNNIGAMENLAKAHARPTVDRGVVIEGVRAHLISCAKRGETNAYLIVRRDSQHVGGGEPWALMGGTLTTHYAVTLLPGLMRWSDEIRKHSRLIKAAIQHASVYGILWPKDARENVAQEIRDYMLAEFGDINISDPNGAGEIYVDWRE